MPQLNALYNSSNDKSFGKVHYQGWDVTALGALHNQTRERKDYRETYTHLLAEIDITM